MTQNTKHIVRSIQISVRVITLITKKRRNNMEIVLMAVILSGLVGCAVSALIAYMDKNGEML